MAWRERQSPLDACQCRATTAATVSETRPLLTARKAVAYPCRVGSCVHVIRPSGIRRVLCETCERVSL